MKIKRLILLLLLLFIILPAVLICAVGTVRFCRTADALTGNNVRAVTSLQAQSLGDFFAQRAADLRIFSKLPDTLDLLGQHAKGERRENYPDLLRESNIILTTRVRDQSFALRMSLLDSEGVALASSDEGFIGERTLLSQEDWVRLSQDQVVISDLRTTPRFQDGLPHFFIAYPILVDGSFEGAAITVMDCSYFSRMIGQDFSFETGTLTVLDPSGQVAASGNSQLKGSVFELGVENDLGIQWQAIDPAAAPSGSLRFSIGGVKKLGYYSTVAAPGWTVLGAVDLWELEAPVRQALISTGWAVGALALAFLVMYLVLSRQFSYPLVRLSESIRRMRQGDYSDRYVYNKPNEFGEISTALGELMDAVQTKQAQLTESNRDLEALTANIPGGVHRCLADEYGTFDYVSEGYLKLIGYTQSQLERVFHNQFYYTIYEKDREQTMRRLREQLEAGDEAELEYRLVRPDGTVIWVYDKGRRVRGSKGEDLIYCVLLDVTGSKKAQEELRANEERLRIILDQTEDIIFEWHLLEDCVTYSANWERKFGRPPVYHNFVEEALAQKDVHPDDVPAFVELMGAIQEGRLPYGQAELRLRRGEGASGQYIWCRLRVTAQADRSGQVYKAVGVIVDIDSEKRAALKLLQKSQRDPLTKLYNRSTAYKLISGILERERGPHALMILDIDDFKSVNDSLGHLFGDAVLTDIAARLTKLSRPGEIASRIGGDEFLLFLPGAGGEEAQAQAKEIEAALRHTFKTSFQEYRLTASLGLALAPEHGSSYTALFQNADTALYAAKKRGKGCCCLYSEGVRAEALHGGQGETIGHVQTVMETRGGWNERLSDQIFKILYDSKDTATAVRLILEIVGRYYGVSRAYIFENSPDDSACSNTYEWCAEGVSPAKDSLQDIPYSTVGDYPANFNEEGVFYCGDIHALPPGLYELLAPQGISSMLQCAILDDGRFKGYVGFDECAAARLWTKEEIDTLTLVAQIVGIFLLKQRAQDKLAAAYERQRSVMDSMDNWTYVINQETYELLYLNHKTQLIAPNAKVGERCYEAFFGGRSTPCRQCPMRALREEASNCTMEIHNKVLGVWSAATASRLDWEEGVKAVLLCCNDITKYKEPKGPVSRGTTPEAG